MDEIWRKNTADLSGIHFCGLANVAASISMSETHADVFEEVWDTHLSPVKILFKENKREAGSRGII